MHDTLVLDEATQLIRNHSGDQPIVLWINLLSCRDTVLTRFGAVMSVRRTAASLLRRPTLIPDFSPSRWISHFHRSADCLRITTLGVSSGDGWKSPVGRVHHPSEQIRGHRPFSSGADGGVPRQCVRSRRTRCCDGHTFLFAG